MATWFPEKLPIALHVYIGKDGLNLRSRLLFLSDLPRQCLGDQYVMSLKLLISIQTGRKTLDSCMADAYRSLGRLRNLCV